MTRLFVTAKPKARENKVEKIDETHYRIWVKDPPDKGKANAAIIHELSRFLGVPKARLSLLRGQSSKNKIIGLS